MSVTDQRLSQIKKYQESDFTGEQFVSIHKLSESLAANSRMLDFFSVLIQTQSDENSINEEKISPALLAKTFTEENLLLLSVFPETLPEEPVPLKKSS